MNAMNAMDRHARKQVLLTRIAFERRQLRGELAQLGNAARWPNLLRDVVGSAARGAAGGAGSGSDHPIGSIVGALFGATRQAANGNWVGVAASLLQRYRWVAALLGTAAPLVRGQRGWRRLVRVGGLAGVVWLGWCAYRRRRQGSEPPMR